MVTEINPDEEFVKELRKSLRMNGGYCPSLMMKTKDSKCMCKEFREQETEGYCRCGLYHKVNK